MKQSSKRSLFNQKGQKQTNNEGKNQHFTHNISALKLYSPSTNKNNRIILPLLKEFSNFDYQSDSMGELQRKAKNSLPQKVHFFANKTIQRSRKKQPPKNFSTNMEDNLNYISISQRKVDHDIGSEKAGVFNKMKRKFEYKYISQTSMREQLKCRKRIQTQVREDIILPSLLPSYTKQKHVIFHKLNKNFQGKRNIVEHSITKSSLYDLAEIAQNLHSFIASYSPLDPSFTLKQILKEPSTQIVSNPKTIFIGKIGPTGVEGKGILINQDQLFEGQFQKGLKIKGCEKNSRGIFYGTFAEGKRDGMGKFIWGNGQIYQGFWKKGKKNGHGIWKSPRGDYYEGSWKDNHQNGKGCFNYTGFSLYRGYFLKSLKNGHGEEEFANKDKYSGQYIEGKPHGYGKYIWQNGDYYEGDFSGGMREGKGSLRLVSGQKYQGYFSADQKQGYGRESTPQDGYFEGVFSRGLKVSGTYFSKEGNILLVLEDEKGQ